MSQAISGVEVEERKQAGERRPSGREQASNSFGPHMKTDSTEGEADPVESVSNLESESGQPPADLVEQLSAENAELREHLTKLEQLLADAQTMTQTYEEQQKDLEKLLEEKSDVIRELHLKVQEQSRAHEQSKLQEQSRAPEQAKQQEQPPRSPMSAPQEHELLALSEELEKERQQLKEDE